jgi:hypothetical protein
VQNLAALPQQWLLSKERSKANLVMTPTVKPAPLTPARRKA